jgi:hypothetical protein
MRVHCCIPPTIAVPRPTPDNLRRIDAICDAMPDYWRGLPDSFVTRLETELETWLTETESWSHNARMFGHNDKHDQLSIWRDDDGNLERINMRFSLANPDSSNLSRLLTMPSLTDCLFHGIQSESVYVPTLENWIADMRMSSASRWLRGGDYLDTKMRG